jgi:hypothetical protein
MWGMGSRSRSESPCWRSQTGVSGEEKVRATFVRDLSVPDRSETLPNQTLVKTWAVQNTGCTQWPEGVKLIFIRGDRDISAQEEFPVPQAKPNETVEVSAVIQTPATKGRYTAHFRLADKDRSFLFGPRLWVDFLVISGEEGKSASTGNTTAATDSKDKSKEAGVRSDSKAQDTTAAPTQPQQQPIKQGQITTEEPAERFALQLKALEGMGFTNRELNLYLLDKENGNVAQVAQWLLNKLKHA